ncbi:MAG: type IV secretory system conjugative DNA transfer family protein [Alphaproteobacteria bacterium]|nr:type IV secretory system conjugative DNA transfer family protein [Alphaproteobacteria bacterium]
MPPKIIPVKPMRTIIARTAALAAILSLVIVPAYASDSNLHLESSAGSNAGTGTADVSGIKIIPADSDSGVSPPPPELSDLENMSSDGDDAIKPNAVGLQIRADAMREAALSYGARGGLAHRTFEIQRRLAEYDASLSKTFDFKRLLITAPSNLLIEPPIVSEADRAVLVNGNGQQAAVADRIYSINRAARIVTAARDWHLYLERDWGRVDPPPAVLLPKTDEEKAAWAAYVKQGWDAGVKQADDIFESDLDRMTNDFVGMVRYRVLLAQGMISAPYALAENRGVTGGGNEMRIGDRGVSITGQSQLIPQSGSWTPATR